MPINILELLEKRTRLHGGKGYLTTVRVIAGCNGSFFDGLNNFGKFIPLSTLSQIKKLHIYTGDNPVQSVPVITEVIDLLDLRPKTGLKLNIELKNNILFYGGMEERNEELVTKMIFRIS